ncbi:MAG: GGDEF domain-containing protein [Anaerovorax sp.]
MKLLIWLKSNFLGNVEATFYSENKELLAERNYGLIKKACVFSVFMCGFLFALTFLNGLIAELKNFYLFFTLFFVIETGIVFVYVKRHKEFSGLFFYIFAIAIFFLAADIGTFKSPDVFAVTFYVFLIIIPMLHVGRPIWAVMLSVGACAGFCLLTYVVKSSAPLIAANDILNAVCCCIVGIGLNVTILNLQLESLQSKVQLEHMSFIDELTSLPNRRSLNLYIESIFEDKKESKNEAINMVMMDIDDFKCFNDSWGHLEGDVCLRKIGALLYEIGEAHQLFVARFGGEEFVAINTTHDRNTLEKICEEIIRKVEALHIKSRANSSKNVTMSIGYSDLESSGAKNYIELIHCADAALYFSKVSGKNKATLYKSYMKNRQECDDFQNDGPGQ